MNLPFCAILLMAHAALCNIPWELMTDLLSIGIIQKVDKTLRFNKDHEFTILQITDLHYGNSDSLNNLNMSITHKLMDLVKPDVVVITGDAVSGDSKGGKTADFFRSKWKKFTKPFLNRKTLYAYVLGNRDHQGDLSYQQIADLDKTHPYSLFAGDPSIDPNSISNYKLEVLSSFPGKENTPSALLWCLDSKDTGCMGVKDSYGCITQNQLDWYTQLSKDTNKKYNQKIDGLAFFHIPTPEFLEMWVHGKTYGGKLEFVSCPKVNTGVIQSFKDNDNVKAVFVGHDHYNDFGGFFEDIELVMCRKTGFGSSGPLSSEGGRVIKLKETLNDKNEVGFTYSHYTMTYKEEVIRPSEPKYRGRFAIITKCAGP